MFYNGEKKDGSPTPIKTGVTAMDYYVMRNITYEYEQQGENGGS